MCKPILGYDPWTEKNMCGRGARTPSVCFSVCFSCVPTVCTYSVYLQCVFQCVFQCACVRATVGIFFVGHVRGRAEGEEIPTIVDQRRVLPPQHRRPDARRRRRQE